MSLRMFNASIHFNAKLSRRIQVVVNRKQESEESAGELRGYAVTPSNFPSFALC